MKLHEKINLVRKQQDLSTSDLHRRIQNLFGDKAISFKTLQRIQWGWNDGKGQSLYQICMALGTTLQDLKSGTEEEKPAVDLTRRKSPKGQYYYAPETAYAQILTPSHLDFIAFNLVLEPGAATRLDKDPDGTIAYTKFLRVEKGTVKCLIAGKKYTLHKGDSLSFDSRLPHTFENSSPKTSNCVLVQYPRHL